MQVEIVVSNDGAYVKDPLQMAYHEEIWDLDWLTIDLGIERFLFMKIQEYYEIQQEILEWIRQHRTSFYIFTGFQIWFHSADDAAHFKLRWL